MTRAAALELYRRLAERAERAPWGEEFFSAVIADVRSRRPESLASLADGFEPTEEVPGEAPGREADDVRDR